METAFEDGDRGSSVHVSALVGTLDVVVVEVFVEVFLEETRRKRRDGPPIVSGATMRTRRRARAKESLCRSRTTWRLPGGAMR